MSMEHPPLDRWRFDAIASGPEKLWGLSTIATAMGCSIDKARRLAQLDEVPIYQPPGAGTYFALRSELNAWLRSK